MDIKASEITSILKQQLRTLTVSPRFLRLDRFFLSVMVLQEFMVWIMCRPVRWLNSPVEFVAWR